MKISVIGLQEKQSNVLRSDRIVTGLWLQSHLKAPLGAWLCLAALSLATWWAGHSIVSWCRSWLLSSGSKEHWKRTCKTVLLQSILETTFYHFFQSPYIRGKSINLALIQVQEIQKGMNGMRQGSPWTIAEAVCYRYPQVRQKQHVLNAVYPFTVESTLHTLFSTSVTSDTIYICCVQTWKPTWSLLMSSTLSSMSSWSSYTFTSEMSPSLGFSFSSVQS